MIKKTVNGVNHYEFDNLSKYSNILNFVSSIDNGNMAFVNGNNQEVLSNITQFLSSFDISVSQCVFAEQIHGGGIAIVDENTKYREATDTVKYISGVDALITKDKNRCLIIKTADCVPLILFDPIKKIVGIVHAGWRGTLENISGETVVTMKLTFKSNPKDLLVAVGPSIGPKDYFVKEDVWSKFEAGGLGDFLKYQSPNQWLLDLNGLNIKQLMDSGVNTNNIEVSGISTYSSSEFFSFRRNESMGHFITGVMLK